MSASRRSMNVCFLIARMSGFGGTERAACAISSGICDLDRIGQVHLMALMGDTECRFDIDSRVTRQSLLDECGSMTSRFPSAVLRLRRYLRERQIDTLIVVESTLSLYAIPAAFALGVRVICWEHFNFKIDHGRRKRSLARQLAALLAHDVVTLTERDKAQWMQRTAARARIHAIANPVQPCDVPPIYDEMSRTVLTVGRLSPEKGLDRLLDAWCSVKQDPASESWQLLIVGNGDESERLAEQAKRLGIGESVTFEPATTDIYRYYERASIVCCSSHYEGLPMVLIEATERALPIVSFDCETGPREIVIDGESGLLVPPGNCEAFSRALCKLMGDAPTRVRMSRRARESSVRFSRDTIVSQWKALLFDNPRHHRSFAGTAVES